VELALRAMANGKYVTAENAGASPLIANRTQIGAWETFKWLSLGGNDFALRSPANGRLVCAESSGNSALIANRSEVGAWETFTYLPR
jgi:hypothetical protein